MNTKSIAVLSLFFFACFVTTAQDAKALVSEMMEALGGKRNFYALKSVTYDYHYKSPNGTELASHETYVFQNERSHATYSKHSMLGPGGEKIVEGYDGTHAWIQINGKLSGDEKANTTARFMRKTNYYWFTMFFKLLDSGVIHKYQGSKTIGGKTYDIVQISFGENIGDAQDIYVLYINRKTKLVDQFLFTVMGMGRKDPLLMKVQYETINGIKIPSKRKYIEADWGANGKGDKWTTTDWTNIKFGSTIEPSIFNIPSYTKSPEH